MENTCKISLTVLFIVGILINLPFLNMALHTDEWGYLLMGERILQNPADPYHGTEKYEGEIVTLKESSTFGPVIPYYFAFILAITGSNSEVVLRLFFIFFSGIALISIFEISRRFLCKPMIPALLAAFSPSFFLLSHVTTTDMSGMAMSLLGFALYMNYRETCKIYLGIFAGLSLGISFLIRYQNLYILPIILIYSKFYWKELKRAIIVVVISIIVLMPWFIHNLCYYGNLHILTAGKAWKGAEIEYSPFSFLNTIPDKILSSLAIWGSSFIFLPFIILALFKLKRSKAWIWISTSLSIILILIIFNLTDYSISSKIQLTGFSLSGLGLAFLLSYGIPTYWKRAVKKEELHRADKDFIFHLFWFLLIELMIIVFMPFNSVRYSLPMIVPVVIFFSKLLIDNFEVEFFRKFVISCLILSFIYGGFVAYGDLKLANAYRDFVDEKVSHLISKNKEVYFIGEEGFRGCMQNAGAQYLMRDDSKLDVGSIVVIPTFLHQYPINPELMKSLELIERVPYESSYPVRIVNPRAKTSFFCYYAGFLPFSLSNESIEEFRIYQVK